MKCVLGAVTLVAAVCLVASGCSDSSDPVGIGSDGISNLQPLDMPAPSVPTVTTPLIAGRTIPVGEVTCWLEGDILKVSYSTHDGWMLAQTHLAVALELGDIRVTAVGNPKVGHFPYSMNHMPPVAEYTYPVDLEAMQMTEADELVLAAHAEVVLIDEMGEVIQQEGAWAEGETFPDLWPTKHPEFKDKNNPDAASERERNWAMYFTVNMAELRGLLLWNKLGSETEVLNSEVGPDGVIVGDIEYLPCRHGNGFKSLPRTGDHNIPDNFIDFPDLVLGDKGCVEFWMHPDWNNYLVGHVVDIFEYGVPDVVGRYEIAMGFNDWQNMGAVAIRDYLDATAYEFAGVWYRPYQISEWSTTQPFHVAVVWDGTTPLLADRVRLYFNGIDARLLGGWVQSTGNPDFESFPAGSVLRLNMRLFPGDWDRHHWESDCQIIDNIKVWNYPKTDFSDRFVE